jgi:hypothetical protein
MSLLGQQERQANLMGDSVLSAQEEENVDSQPANAHYFTLLVRPATQFCPLHQSIGDASSRAKESSLPVALQPMKYVLLFVTRQTRYQSVLSSIGLNGRSCYYPLATYGG